jgi:hypothetical protein
MLRQPQPSLPIYASLKRDKLNVFTLKFQPPQTQFEPRDAISGVTSDPTPTTQCRHSTRHQAIPLNSKSKEGQFVCASISLGTELHTPHDMPCSIAILTTSIECEAEGRNEECESKQHSNYHSWPPMPRQNLIENQRGHEIDKTTSPETQGPLFHPPVLSVAYPVGVSRPKPSTSSRCCFLSLHLPSFPPSPQTKRVCNPGKNKKQKNQTSELPNSSSRRGGSHPCTLYLFGCAKDEPRPSIVPQRERLADASVDDLSPPCSDFGRISHGYGSRVI